MAEDSFDLLLSDFWKWRLQRSPEFATMAGSKLFNHILEEFTEARFEADFEACKVFLKRSKALAAVVDSEEKEELEFFEAERLRELSSLASPFFFKFCLAMRSTASRRCTGRFGISAAIAVKPNTCITQCETTGPIIALELVLVVVKTKNTTVYRYFNV